MLLSLILQFAAVLASESVNPTNTTTLARIVQGTPVGSNSKFPFLAVLSIQKGDSKAQCTGMLLDESTLLTAAHCSQQIDLEKTQVVVNVDSLSRASKDGVFFSVEKVFVHPSFSERRKFQNDVAVWKIKKQGSRALQLGKIALDDGRSNQFVGRSLTVAGWGATSFGGPPSDTLLKVDLEVRSDADCVREYGIDTRIAFCAGRGGKDSCQGDSGGPLFQVIGDQVIVVGIVSFGEECGKKSGVYTRVSAVSRFILDARASSSLGRKVSIPLLFLLTLL